MIPAQILTTSQDLLFELPTTLKSKERLIVFATHNRELSDKADIQLAIQDSNVRILK